MRASLETDEMSLYRMVVRFAEDGTPEALVDFARGVSEDPGSPRFADQHERWARCELVPLPFRKAEVDAQVSERIILFGAE